MTTVEPWWVAAIAATTLLVGAFATSVSMASDVDLGNTAAKDWPLVGADRGNSRYSQLAQITSRNIQELGGAWTVPLTGQSSVATPVVAGGRMFTTIGAEVRALNPKTGETLWSYKPEAPPSRKGVAVGDGLVFVGLLDAHLVALRQDNGQHVWTAMVGDDGFEPAPIQGASGPRPPINTQMISSVPAFVRGMVITGMANGDFGLRGRIVGLNAKTGKVAWRFDAIPAPGEPGSETWQQDNDVWKTGGGGVWMPPAIDESLGLAYLGIGNPVPQWGGEVRAGDNLYTDAVVALDIKTGKLRWHYQVVHHDIWDHDLGTPLVLYDAVVEGKPRKAIAVMRTDGYLFLLDRKTGQPVFPTAELPVPQNARLKTAKTQPFPIGADAIGPRCVEQEMVPEGFRRGCYFEPIDFDQPNFMTPLLTTRAAPMAFSPDTKFFYATASVAPYWVKRTQDPYFFSVLETEGMKNYGLIVAIDSRSNKIAWQHRVANRIDAGSGAMATAGGLVFHGEPSGNLQAYAADSGKLLWEFQTGSSVQGAAMSYEFEGQQYVAAP